MEVLPKERTLELRKKHIGEACRLWYPTRPLKIVRAKGQYMYDEEGNAYLDCINNVCHVGHSHPRVVEAAAKQMAIVNTNNRFLHDTLVQYAERLTSTMPEKLSVCFLVNSGSEANDLAIQLAQKYTGHKDVITLDHAYHGHLQTVLAISPYKHKLLGKDIKKKWVHVVSPPDMYRGQHCKAENPGEAFANDVKDAIDKAHAGGRQIAAFFAESLQSCGGQLVYPPGYFRNVFRHVHEAGGICVADEVQVGFGRVGEQWWGFQTQGSDIIPDIVTMGKPMGNGHPIAAVVTTPEIAASMGRGGYQYFNTYGGNPVSCAVGMAVLDIIRDEKLRENATVVGDFLRKELLQMKQRYEVVGDVRGLGMFIGIELVRSKATKEPAADEATFIVEFLRDKFILLSTEGPYSNVLKFKPPMCFSMDDARHLLACLSEALQEIESLSAKALETVAEKRRFPGQAIHRLAPKPLDIVPVLDVGDVLLGESSSASSPSSASDDSGLDLSPTRATKDVDLRDADTKLTDRPKKRQKIESN
ncbi:5-phosphohydroxy-L-lysine phospho-lyase-like [Acanthaster planci]|uniref:5-phosphohydroxy-L-lysine phospho-lyase-like n=1 Tax=Acanthaster planci TaxID=133434 RepID=A0A8B7YS00_ACAPL|nr:5-phosphohydroxy-L-lysine phospho-lyase-like [Acanthaster planci]